MVVVSLGLLLFRGLNLGIDFTGGNVIQVEFDQQPDVADVREAVSTIIKILVLTIYRGCGILCPQT